MDKSKIYNTTGTAKSDTTGLVAYYPLIGNTNDISGNGKNGTADSITYTSGRFGINAATFSTSKMTISSALLASTVTTYTISMWLNPTSVTSGGLFQLATSVDQYSAFYYLNAGKIAYDVYTPSGGTIETTNAILTTGNWQHLVIQKNGSNITFYVNGQFKQTIVTAESNTNAVTATTIGYRYYYNILYYAGQMRNLRVYNRVITLAEIKHLFTENPTLELPLDKYLYYPINGNANEIDGVSNGTVTGAVNFTAANESGVANTAASFSGSAQRINTNWGNAYNLKLGFTFVIKFKISNQSVLYRRPISAQTDNVNYTTIGVQVSSGTQGVFLRDYNNTRFKNFAYTFALDTWYVAALTIGATSAAGYINGVSIGTDTLSTNAYTLPTNLYLAYNPVAGSYFAGTIDYCYIYKRALEPEEISAFV